jgi:hypothetical protein
LTSAAVSKRRWPGRRGKGEATLLRSIFQSSVASPSPRIGGAPAAVTERRWTGRGTLGTCCYRFVPGGPRRGPIRRKTFCPVELDEPLEMLTELGYLVVTPADPSRRVPASWAVHPAWDRAAG